MPEFQTTSFIYLFLGTPRSSMYNAHENKFVFLLLIYSLYRGPSQELRRVKGKLYFLLYVLFFPAPF